MVEINDIGLSLTLDGSRAEHDAGKEVNNVAAWRSDNLSSCRYRYLGIVIAEVAIGGAWNIDAYPYRLYAKTHRYRFC